MSNPLTLLVDVKGGEWVDYWKICVNIKLDVCVKHWVLLWENGEVWVIELREYIRGIYASRGMWDSGGDRILTMSIQIGGALVHCNVYSFASMLKILLVVESCMNWNLFWIIFSGCVCHHRKGGDCWFVRY